MSEHWIVIEHDGDVRARIFKDEKSARNHYQLVDRPDTFRTIAKIVETTIAEEDYELYA